MSGLATGLLSGSVHKAISGNGVVGDGLYLHKHDKCYQWAYGVVVSMFDFHRSDRGSNPGRGGKISCLRLHYRAGPLASV